MLNFDLSYSYYPWFSPTSLPASDLPAIQGQINVTVTPTFYQGNYISWTVPPYWGACIFNLYRAQNDALTPTLVNKAPISVPDYFDFDAVSVSSFNQQFYTIEAVLPNGTIAKSTPTTWVNIQNQWVALRAREIQRRENIFLTKFFGVQSLFYRKKFFGQRCSRCWNATIEKVMDDHCPVCFGTGFEGGYWPPVNINVNYSPVQNAATLAPAGVLENVQISSWTTSYPNIQNFDLVFRISDSKMFRVVAVQPTELQAVRVRQTLALTELDKDSIEYQLPG